MSLPNIDIVDKGTHEGIRWWIGHMQRPFYGGDQYNGYVELQYNHPIVMIGTNVSLADRYFDVHGGITWASGDIVGFDTNHLDDTAENWPLSSVRYETLDLAEQVYATNTQANRMTAIEISNLRSRIEASTQRIEDLGFSTYDIL